MRSLAGLCDHLIAVDGAYALYPNGSGRSPHAQGEAIRETAREIGIGLTLHEPAEPWAGNEIAKRAYMFRLGATLTTNRDWYFAIDGDEIVTHVPDYFREDLAGTSWNVGTVDLWHASPGYTIDQPIRQLFRAFRGLSVSTNHYTYHTRNRLLWGQPTWRGLSLEPAFDSGIQVEHRWQARDAARLADRAGYYAERDSRNIEGLV